MLFKWKHVKWVLGNTICRWWVSVETHRWNEASQVSVQRGECFTSVALKNWALAAQLSSAGSPTQSHGWDAGQQSQHPAKSYLLYPEVTSIPRCAPVVPQLPGSKSQKRCAWQVSLDLFDVVFGMGCVHWLLWGLGCWVRTCQVSETGWVSGADLSAPLHCPCWESRNRHIPGTRHQPRDPLFNVSVKQNSTWSHKG